MKRDQSNAIIEKTSSVGVLAEDYRQDLQMLRVLSPVLVSPADMDMLEVIARKYGHDVTVDRENYVKTLGKINSIVREKLEKLAIVHELESVRDETPGRKPKEDRVKMTQKPEVFEEEK